MAAKGISNRYTNRLRYHAYSENTVAKAVEWMNTYKKSLRQTEKKFGIPKSTLAKRKTQTVVHQYGRPKVLNEKDQQFLAEGLATCADWGFPLTHLDVRYLVKWFLDKNGLTETRFHDNLPSVQWVRKFIESRPELSERLAENIKRARAGINTETINQYFDNLEQNLVGVKPQFIVNYDETCFVDDIGKKKIITRRGCKHPERIIDTSKTSISVMFSCAASGYLLPPYVCYKSEHLHDSWKNGGPRGCRYNRTRSGWFDSTVFEDWFKTIIIPYFNSVEASEDAVGAASPKVIIGDNLASHVNANVIELCKNKNIRFILLPPNSTHLCQPLDVCVFRPIKGKWRTVLQEWKERYRGNLRKDSFPSLLKNTLNLLPNISETIISGFQSTGIYPTNRFFILRRLPEYYSTNESSTNEERATLWTEGIINVLDRHRKSVTEVQQCRRRITVEAGKSLAGDDEEESDVDNPAPILTMQTSEPANEEMPLNDQMLEPTPSTSSAQIELQTDAVETSDSVSIKEKDFVIVFIIFNFGTKNEKKKFYLGRVLKTKAGRKNEQIKLDLMRKVPQVEETDTISFKFPQIRDIFFITPNQIICQVPSPVKERRSIFTFLKCDISCDEPLT